MGFYSREKERDREESQKNRINRWLIPLLIAVVAGVLLAAVIIPIGSGDHNHIATRQDLGGSDTGTNQLNQPNITNTNLNVNVTTQITEAVDEVTPAVVGITNIQNTSRGELGISTDPMQAGTGSGVIYKADGDTAYVVTNQHVVAGADTVEVVLYDGRRVEAEIIGGDLFTDIAVLQMDVEPVEQVIEIGSSSDLRAGEPAIAIGNPLGHMFSSTVTEGVISGTERTIPQDFDQNGVADWQAEVIQTDAAINPGNSGGALININGQLIGINSMKVSEDAVEGIGFAIPIDRVIPIIAELEATGAIERPYIGIEVYSLADVPEIEWQETLNLPDEIEGGVYVWSVASLSPAARAGVERLDVITELDGQPIGNMVDLRQILYEEKDVGDEVSVTLYRNGERMETSLTLGEQ